MKWVAYNLAFALVFPFLLPGFLLRMLRRGGYRARMGDRFALYPGEVLEKFRNREPPAFAKATADRPTTNHEPRTTSYIWIHAVSVGEVQVAGQLMRAWRKVEPGVRFCFSTTSSTGWRTAEREVGPDDVLIYNPLDFPTFVTAALRTVRPRAVVLTESEIWPVFIRGAAKRGIPLFLVNARVSDRSAPRYAKARFLFRDVFSAFARIFAQSDLDRARLLAAGAPEDRVDVTGSFKFDVAHRNPAKEAELAAWIGDAAKGRRILLGGSTWPGEDRVLLDIHSRLVADGLPSLLVIAPRHFEKADAVEANIRAAGFDCIRRSRDLGSFRVGLGSLGSDNVDSAPATNHQPLAFAEATAGKPATDHEPRTTNHQPPVFLADTTGELMGLYGIADFVFVGKSLCEHGSQNMIEPCLCGKPTVVGPNTENFRPVMSDLLGAKGIVQVADAAELERTVRGWFERGDGGLGARAKAAVARRTGVVPGSVAAIRAKLAQGGAAADGHGKAAGVASTILKSLVFSLLLAATCAALLYAVPALWPRDGKPGRAAVELQPKRAKTPTPKLGAVRIAGAFLSMIENPYAQGVCLAGDEAECYAQIFAAAGRDVKIAGDAKDGELFDIVLTSVPPADGDWSPFTARLEEGGVLACALDVRGMKAGAFKAVLESFPCEGVRVWMPGERDWLVTGRTCGEKLRLEDVLGFFSQQDGMITVDAEEAGCGTVQELFASYAGTREELLPAFGSGDADSPVAPECFLPVETPDLEWIDPDGLDADIVSGVATAIRALQENRRLAVRGAVLSREGKTDEAVSAWAAAYAANPHDTLLLDRLYQLIVNARAFEGVGRMDAAADCYDVYLNIRPTDLRVADEYAKTLRMLGRDDEAALVENYAMEAREELMEADCEDLKGEKNEN